MEIGNTVYYGIGWMYAYAIQALDKNIDLRTIPITKILEDAKKHFELES